MKIVIRTQNTYFFSDVFFTVYRELWKLHQGKNLKAHFALSFISDTMEHNKGRLMVITSKGDSIPHAQLAKREVVIERVSFCHCVGISRKIVYYSPVVLYFLGK